MSKKKKEEEPRLYAFDVRLVGIGFDKDSAWEDALEGFIQDPGPAGKPVAIRKQI